MLTSILIPFFSKRFSAEFVCLMSILCLPSTWISWSQPTPWSVSLMSDKLSAILVLLTVWTVLLMLMMKPVEVYLKLNTLLLLWSLVYFFCVSSLLAFFILFELSLIPTLLIVLGWGGQPERVEASLYFIFYTVAFSIPLLISLIWMTVISGKKYLYFDSAQVVSSNGLGVLMLIVFMIKLPLFLMHFWLPKAHVEAPVTGSMVLAAVLLKTGGYGIVRIFMYMSKTLTCLAFSSMGLLGMVYICLVCLYCVDLKQLIAYSSVSHMNFMIVGLMSNSVASYSGVIVMMVSHGICSSLMFMLVDFVYKRTSSRSLLINKGLLSVIPALSMLWGISVMFNMGVPPSAGSLSELLIIASSEAGLLHSFMFMLYLFFSAFYSVYLYMSMNHGIPVVVTLSLSAKEMLMSLSHLLPLGGLSLVMKCLAL